MKRSICGCCLALLSTGAALAQTPASPVPSANANAPVVVRGASGNRPQRIMVRSFGEQDFGAAPSVDNAVPTTANAALPTVTSGQTATSPNNAVSQTVTNKSDPTTRRVGLLDERANSPIDILRHRSLEIERMRAEAQRNNNPELLRHADQMQRDLEQRFAAYARSLGVRDPQQLLSAQSGDPSLGSFGGGYGGMPSAWSQLPPGAINADQLLGAPAGNPQPWTAGSNWPPSAGTQPPISDLPRVTTPRRSTQVIQFPGGVPTETPRP